MATNSRETALQAIRAALLGVVGSDYEFPPKKVLRCSFVPEAWIPDPTVGTLYYIWPETNPTRLGDDTCSKTDALAVVVRAYTRLNEATENPSAENPARSRLAFGMETDVKEALYAAADADQFGGAIHAIEGNTITAEYLLYDPAYVAVDLRFTLTIHTGRPGR
jgi:hypothetical protein